METQDLFVRMNADGVVSRRSFLRATAGAAGLGALGWADAVRGAAADLRQRGMACILLFMNGGPSQFETFDPKPGTSTGGETKAIDTAVEGVQIAEAWPKVAKQMKEIALIRSMTGREGNHERAQYLLHTGYAPTGSVKYPTFGSVAARELGDPKFDLPHFVCVGRGSTAGSGYLGMKYAPYIVGDPNRLPANTALPSGVDDKALKRRLGLMDKLEKDFADQGAEAVVADHRELNHTAARMVLSPRLKAFDLSQEKGAVRDAYGRSSFGQGCLLARRLVETGVTFVEVVSGGWDTHRENFTATKNLARVVDPAYAALLADLKDRGMLSRTLVIWMGEFGRTPRINGNKGRDHYPRSFCVALSGAGVKGGQVIGATNKGGTDLDKRPVTVPDLFCTLCEALKIKPRKQYIANGRPMKIVEAGKPVTEVFG